MYRLLEEFGKITNYPILLNTSFNLKDQTMVRDTREALQTFMSCDMDYLIFSKLFIYSRIKKIKPNPVFSLQFVNLYLTLVYL